MLVVRKVSMLNQMPNIGPVLQDKLMQAGVQTPEKLAALGSRQAFTRILLKDQSACLNKLYALEGAIQGVRWHDLAAEQKRELKIFYKALKLSKHEHGHMDASEEIGEITPKGRFK
jgi:DNA transformation protein